MANKINPKLGHNVTTRTLNWGQMVRESWGTEWDEREVIYRWSNGDEMVENNNTKYGVYGISIYDGIIISPIPEASEMYLCLLTEDGNRISLDGSID